MAASELIKANLLHLSYNMWADREDPERPDSYTTARPYLRFDESLWRDILRKMVENGLNMVIIDLGDGIRYESHPEIAVRGAWSPEKLREELKFIRGLGLEPIPKLNFSACHDVWLGPYSRCLSTDTYYAVCADLIEEVIRLFDTPRFFHLGMDEETANHQRRFEYVGIRQFDLWWHDFLFYVERVEKAGVRAWIWSDYIWNNREVFLRRMPKSVLQSNWYYDVVFNDTVNYVKAYHDLEEHGFDQVPTGSNWSHPDNFGMTVEYCRKIIAPERLKGFLQTPWKPTLEAERKRHVEAVEQVGRALRGL